MEISGERDIQTILGHAHLTTTQIYLESDDHEVIGRVRDHLADRGDPRPKQSARPAIGYDSVDLTVLFGRPLQ